MEFGENRDETIRSILNNASQKIKYLEDELTRVETPTRNNLELQPPGHTGNRYSIHIEQQKFKLRSEIDNVKSEARSSIDNLLSDKDQAAKVVQKDYEDAEVLRPVNFQKQSRDISESQDFLSQEKLEANLKSISDKNEIQSKEDSKFFSRMGSYFKNKSDIEQIKAEPDLDKE